MHQSKRKSRESEHVGLNKWLLENTDCETTSLYDGLHVIGTCGECKFYKPDGMEAEDPWKNFLPCSRSRVSQNFIAKNKETFPPKDFGCIHFEPKEGS